VAGEPTLQPAFLVEPAHSVGLFGQLPTLLFVALSYIGPRAWKGPQIPFFARPTG